MKPSDKYLKVVEWSEEDGCYVGTCPGLLRGGVHGDDEAKVYQELCQVVAETVELYQVDGKLRNLKSQPPSIPPCQGGSL